MQSKKFRRLQLAAIAASMLTTAPARADKVICDGNLLCLVAVVPLALAGVAIAELKKPQETRGETFIRTGDIARLEKLIRADPSYVSDPSKSRVLLAAAARAGSIPAAEVLIKAGVSPRAEHSRVLWIATTPELIRYLIANGAVAADVQLSYLQSHLVDARLPALLAVLLEERGKPLDPNDSGAIILLDAAAGRERGDVVKILLKHGVNPSGDALRLPLLTVVKSCAGRAPGCQTRALAIMRDLLEAGADVKAIDRTTGRSALQIARQMAYAELVKLLEEAGAQDRDAASSRPSAPPSV